MIDLPKNWTTVITSFLAALVACVTAVIPVLVGLRKRHKLLNSRLDQLLANRERAAKAMGRLEGAEEEHVFEKARKKIEGNRTMKELFAILPLTGLLLCGCSTTTPQNSRAIAKTTTYVATTVGLQQYPEIKPYVMAATPIICNAAGQTNAVPAEVMADLETVPGNAYGVLVLNGVLSIWSATWSPTNINSREILGGICDGLNMALQFSGQRPLGVPYIRGQ